MLKFFTCNSNVFNCKKSKLSLTNSDIQGANSENDFPAIWSQQRIARGLEPQEQSYHAVFLGNPGTGKTTVARIVGEILYQKGVIAEKKFIEVSQSDLLSGYINQRELRQKKFWSLHLVAYCLLMKHIRLHREAEIPLVVKL